MSRIEVTVDGRGDAETLRALLERLESHERFGHDPRFSRAVWEAERETLLARVNAYSALVLHDALLANPKEHA